MFTIEELKLAHSKVKSGAQYPAYVQEIIKIGVTAYSTYVSDGNTFFEGENNYKIQSGPKYSNLTIAAQSNKQQFLNDIKAHQNGKSDFPAFCRQCADHGIEKWVVDLRNMTCTYHDKAGTEILVEKIPNL